MCEENRAALSTCQTKSEAIQLYKRTIDWALEEGYPPLDSLRREFSHNEKEGLFIDRTFHGEVFRRQQCYILHNCSGVIKVDMDFKNAVIPMIYLANGCDITLRRAESEDDELIVVPVYSFGDNRVFAENSERVSFRIYQMEVK